MGHHTFFTKIHTKKRKNHKKMTKYETHETKSCNINAQAKRQQHDKNNNNNLQKATDMMNDRVKNYGFHIFHCLDTELRKMKINV